MSVSFYVMLDIWRSDKNLFLQLCILHPSPGELLLKSNNWWFNPFGHIFFINSLVNDISEKGFDI